MQNVLRKTTGINTLGASTFMKAPALDPQEALTLTANLVISQLILLAVGCVGAVVLAGLSSGDWGAAVLGFAWVGLIGQSLTALDLIPTLAAGCGLAAAFTIVAYLFEKRALSTEKGRQSIMRTRQGVNGELARLPFPALVALMALTGFSEELLFRFALMGIVAHLVALALPAPAAALIALFVASIAFWFSHVRYRDLATTVLTRGLALVLGAQHRKNPLFLIAVATLLVSPVLQIGYKFDFSMRFSIPGLAILSVMSARMIVCAIRGQGSRYPAFVLALLLAIGAITPMLEFERGAYKVMLAGTNFMYSDPYGTVMHPDADTYNFVCMDVHDAPFYRFIARKGPDARE